MSENSQEASQENSAETTETQTNTQESKTYSQEEVNSMLANQKRKIHETFADFNTYKETAESLPTLKEEAYNEGVNAATAKFVNRLVESGIKAKAQEMRFHNPADALLLFGDTSIVTFDDESGVDEDAITKRLSEIVAEREYMVKPLATNQDSLSRPQPITAKETGDSNTKFDPREEAAAALRNMKKK